MAETHILKLLKKEEVAAGTMRFEFEKPAGFSYKAGQSADWTLTDMKLSDEKGPTRPFSFVSAPHEPYLAFATRIRESAFKQTLKDLAVGGTIKMEGPFGSFTLHENAKRPAIFLSGGIGITPFRSIIADAAARSLPHAIYLFYSNRRPEDAPFIGELGEFAKQNPYFVFIPTMTDMEKSAQSWEGERGYITMDMVKKHVPERSDAVFGLAGPSGMVLAMQKMLTESGVSGDDIRFEEFSGY
jgi:ferredoxin-NADP reductase